MCMRQHQILALAYGSLMALIFRGVRIGAAFAALTIPAALLMRAFDLSDPIMSLVLIPSCFSAASWIVSTSAGRIQATTPSVRRLPSSFEPRRTGNLDCHSGCGLGGGFAVGGDEVAVSALVPHDDRVAAVDAALGVGRRLHDAGPLAVYAHRANQTGGQLHDVVTQNASSARTGVDGNDSPTGHDAQRPAAALEAGRERLPLTAEQHVENR